MDKDYHARYRITHPDQYVEYNRTYRQKQSEQMRLWYEKYKPSMK